MAIVYTFSSTAALTGAVNFNRVHRIAAQEDVGFKIEKLISSVNNLQSAVSFLNSAVSIIHQAIASAIAASQVSALSAPGLVSGGATNSSLYLSVTAISNFTDD